MAETVFKEVRYDLGSLIKFIELGEIGLPDIQRPFVWKNAKVRDLFDSMYKGFPVGYLLLWQNAASPDARPIGTDTKQKASRLLVVDGQQRLTSLYAVIKGINVIRENYNSEAIEIAFSPLQNKFEVADAAIRRDSAYIPNISGIWNSNLFEFVAKYLKTLSAVRDREVTDEERQQIQSSISRLFSLLSYPFTALELASTVDEEQVSRIFVLINSAGKSLNQADFILTLMSVFWDDGRTQLEQFSRSSLTPATKSIGPFNHFIQPAPEQLLRVAVGVGFRRAQLKYVYSILRGKDLETEVFSDERRVQQFKVLQEAQSRVLNLQHWHDFFKVLLQAGYRSASMITSQTNILYCYVFYLIGKTEYIVEEHVLRRVMARWFFMASITGRYTSSPKSTMEFDFARLRDVKDAAGFVAAIEQMCNESITPDYWTVVLPGKLATSSPRSPSLFAYHAALNLLDAQVLFSKQKVSALLDPATNSHRSALERHHLFPKAHLRTLGIVSTRDTNQIANYALVEWGDNSNISEQAPVKYLPKMKGRCSARDLERMYYWHAFPDHWDSLPYPDFLIQRRERIAAVIRDAYEKLCVGAGREQTAATIPLSNLVEAGETTKLEFKSTLRMNLHTGKSDTRIELSVLKTIAGFLNSQGGTLIVGCDDDGEPIGLDADQFSNEDKMNLHLVNIVKERIGPAHMMYIHPRFEDLQEKRVLVVECWPARSPAFVKDNGTSDFIFELARPRPSFQSASCKNTQSRDLSQTKNIPIATTTKVEGTNHAVEKASILR